MLTDQEIAYMRRLNAGHLLGPQFQPQIDDVLSEVQRKRKVVVMPSNGHAERARVILVGCRDCGGSLIAFRSYCPDCGVRLCWDHET
jgi:hypothetical protein